MSYFTDAGPAQGPLLYCDVPGAIGMLKARDNHIPIGVALPVGQDGAGVALWRLVISEVALPGRWVVINREFVPAQ